MRRSCTDLDMTRLNVHSSRGGSPGRFLLGAVVLAGCSFGGASPASESDSERALEQVRNATVDIDITDNTGEAVTEIVVEPLWATLELQDRDADAVLRSFALGLSDVEIPQRPGTIPLHLGEIVLASEFTREPPVAIFGPEPPIVLTTDLVLGWSLINSEGVARPLAPQVIRDVSLAVSVSRVDGLVQADVAATLEGELLDFGAIALRDLSVSIGLSE